MEVWLHITCTEGFLGPCPSQASFCEMMTEDSFMMSKKRENIF